MRPHKRPDDVPTRSDATYWTRAEHAIAAATEAVEAAGASPALTDAVVLLAQARDCAAEHAEGRDPGVRPVVAWRVVCSTCGDELDDGDAVRWTERDAARAAAEACNWTVTDTKATCEHCQPCAACPHLHSEHFCTVVEASVPPKLAEVCNEAARCGCPQFTPKPTDTPKEDSVLFD